MNLYHEVNTITVEYNLCFIRIWKYRKQAELKTARVFLVFHIRTFVESTLLFRLKIGNFVCKKDCFYIYLLKHKTTVNRERYENISLVYVDTQLTGRK